ncbi:ornithine carbamoyltransferase [Lentzea flava]|uniref:Ornithine carbamoyltransferase n=1 Tax=Lentzea flava TaxID=103732 RepID=A0ABQ2URU5_9PSEU|nr:ornithine carbamoyltransferase [Lentzea flava]MCP2197225.1 ornithine carbamoyltransferase [Lentzea flava]GGU50590.1 ornithine carbamoyltransferase [Lentzea flava]
MRHRGTLLKELDLTKEKFLDLVSRARALKRAKASGTEHQLLKGKNIALVFEKSSTRTRCAFEVAAHDQGAHVTYLDPTGSHMGREESVPDTAKVLGRMFDAIEFRGFAQDTVEELADHAGVPVWNGLTDSWHPTQMLADVLTMIEHHDGPVENISFAFVGDGHNNVARSLLVTGALLGMDVRVAAPLSLWPPAEVTEKANELATASGARVRVTTDPEEAVAGADFVYTDVWVSMGDPDEVWDSRVAELTPYRVTSGLMKATGNPDVKFLHCLPSIHDRSTTVGRRVYEKYGLDGAEVADEVFSSPASIVFDQAENRLHTIKAVIVAGLAT